MLDHRDHYQPVSVSRNFWVGYLRQRVAEIGGHKCLSLERSWLLSYMYLCRPLMYTFYTISLLVVSVKMLPQH